MHKPPFWTDERLRLYTGAAFFALAGTILFVILSANGSAGISGRLGGDYAAFHGAGLLIYEGRADELYNWSAQAEIQAPFFSEPGQYLKFPYPPFFALPFAALAPLGFVGSFAVFTAFLWLCLWISAALITPTLGRYDRLRFPIFVGMVFFYPLFRSILGGQNTAITLLLLALMYRCQHDDKPWIGGIALGLLCYKPQFALPLIGLYLLRGHWRALASAALSITVLYGLGVALCGMNWPLEWFGHLEHFRIADQEINQAQAVGLVGFVQALLGSTGRFASGLGYGAAFMVVAALSALWVRRTTNEISLWSLTVCGLILIPPHLLFYDAGLLVLPLLLCLDQTGARWPQAIWAAAFLGVLASIVQFNPLTLLVIVTAILVWIHRHSLDRVNSP